MSRTGSGTGWFAFRPLSRRTRRCRNVDGHPADERYGSAPKRSRAGESPTVGRGRPCFRVGFDSVYLNATCKVSYLWREPADHFTGRAKRQSRKATVDDVESY